MKKALITGVTGQDGSYLTELLLGKGYEVHGLVRRTSTFNRERLAHLNCDTHDPESRLILHYGDIVDGIGLRKVLDKSQPDEIYHLAAQSHVHISFEEPKYTADVIATGTLRMLEATRDFISKTGKSVRFYQASSSEMFGTAPAPQNELTSFHPRSPYAVSKVSAYWFGVNYREAYDMFISNGILFNHESPRRGEIFVTRKVTRAVARIKLGIQKKLYLGNLDAKRDWGFAGDYVEAMWLMMQQEKPDDYVIATGIAHRVQELVEMAFDYAGLDWKEHVEIDDRYLRPSEVNHLCGDYSKAERQLGWSPRVQFPELVKMMVDHDLKLAALDVL